MNFLAHLHIAYRCNSDLAGNLLGDFVKGDPYASYTTKVANGIKLHRFVDSFTDKHEVMKQGKSYFPEELRRFAPIALDLFWDHCLASRWAQYHPNNLDHFCDYAARKIGLIDYHVPERFSVVNKRVWEGRWLQSYVDFDNLEHALYRMSTRSSRMAALAYCFESIDKNYQELSSLFPTLYGDVLVASKGYVESLPQN
ncbi:ACP phosphodiesterase [Vibrio hannami]|uniref:acyl carrier protein phosphodiesterase n=1 Tax=Vibrio hannami TaxID=2717094 RepID=UPI00241069D6|nr:ACP phosphodiesterase [Vibrio hannami]MDG3085594.1 ACP phosphodiesterase [Vibrio hannami]